MRAARSTSGASVAVSASRVQEDLVGVFQVALVLLAFGEDDFDRGSVDGSAWTTRGECEGRYDAIHAIPPHKADQSSTRVRQPLMIPHLSADNRLLSCPHLGSNIFEPLDPDVHAACSLICPATSRHICTLSLRPNLSRLMMKGPL